MRVAHPPRPGPFVLDRGKPDDVRVADGMLGLAGRADGKVRSLVAGFGLLRGARTSSSSAWGQGRNREGLIFELDNHNRESRQTLYPEIGSKQEWREYRFDNPRRQRNDTMRGTAPGTHAIATRTAIRVRSRFA